VWISCDFCFVKQDHLSHDSDSKSGMIILEGDTDDLNTIEENNFEANKKTDEMTGYLYIIM